MEGLILEIGERISLLNKQLDVNQSYLLERVREMDWCSVSKVASQQQAIDQELDSLNSILEQLQESVYE